MHVENAHTHPVIMVFISILQAESFTTLKTKYAKSSELVHMSKSPNINSHANNFLLERPDCTVV